jgi:hypothetical protein
VSLPSYFFGVVNKSKQKLYRNDAYQPQMERRKKDKKNTASVVED